MRIVHLSTSNKGGAGIAALRLHEQLLKQGIDSSFLSLYQFPSEVQSQFRFQRNSISELTDKVLKKLKLRAPYPQALEAKYLKGRSPEFELFSFPHSRLQLEKHPLIRQADIVHLHWVNDGYLDYESFFARINKKVVWTLHDMNPFTGGCHHSDGCMKFIATCDVCPQLKGTIDPSYSAKILGAKAAGLEHVNAKSMQIVAPSEWLTKLSRQSTLFQRFRHSVIPNVLNEKQFTHRGRAEARNRLALPADKKIILFVAHSVSNIRKGGALLFQALSKLKDDPRIMLCTVGTEAEAVSYSIPHASIGYINDDERMADLYAAADVFVLPSMAENFPNTICESLLCGTPVVGFNIGGIPELVTSSNGRLATAFDTDELAECLRNVLEHRETYSGEAISDTTHQLLNAGLNTKKYLAVYDDLIKNHA